ncbi:MAG: LysR family transcriptional regulator [Deltaproteobacteria bacterium]|nr:LysR family transcriptional regulator [Deltaproteobacteria bacterium]PNV84933.1 MAG: LysR family transcriptional regulator [Desulfobacteraceae bacterium]MDH3773534.1 LysR family transcriptional regulator [Deltaproteobacteria bacterium]MDH3800895.1 LysR family transcriptional regulator [Deltaproteobacteria bacterium]MDH3849689.1 LysR family transcriptional regulator [Deltaproteobacteria bacterium]
MEWQQIIGFYQVAKLGSFTKAGDATFRTQSALSQQIKALEQELDCHLFERIGKRKLRLTSAGERFFEFAEAILESYDCLKEDLSELQGLQRGRLRIAAPFTTLYHLVPETLKEYIIQFPYVELTILDRSQQVVIELVRNGDIDLGFTLESEVPKDLSLLRWKRVETVLMVPVGHPLAEAERVTLRQIAKYSLILPPKDLRFTCRRILEERFQKLGLDYQIVMESSNVELTSLYVEMGLGISFATVVRDLPALEKRNLAFIPMNTLLKPDFIAVVMRRDKVLTSYKSAFINILFGEGVD